jgi:hypothetical protein
MSEIEEDPGMAERPAAAIAGSHSLVNVDGFERPHMRPEHSGRATKCPADHSSNPMIRIAAPQSITGYFVAGDQA